MAIEQEIIIKGDTSDADKKIAGVSKGLEDVNNNAKKSSKGISGMGTAVKGLGVAFKALGIGLIVALVSKLVEVFSKNQKVVDGLNTAMEFLNITFNDFISFLLDNSGKVVAFFKDIFENPLENIKKLGEAIKDNIIERFESLLEVLGFVGEAFKKFIAGDFSGALDSVKEAGKELIDVYTGVDNTIGKVGDLVDKVSNSVSEYAKNTFDAAKATVELSNSSELAAAQQARLVEQFDRAAEIQRQIRDDESKSIKERQAANEKLGEILEQQQQAMLRQADLQVAYASSQLAINNNIENQIALTEALGNKEGVLAQVEGFRSEQIVNRIALRKEEIELNNSISDAEKERQLAQLEFEAEQQLTEELKLEKLAERLELENEIILEDIERKRELYKEGTQARVDAEIEYLARKQEIDNELLNNQKEKAKAEKEINQAVSDSNISIAQQSIGLIGEIAGEGAEIGKGLALAQATISGIEGVQNAFTTASKSPITTVNPAYPFIQAGIAGAFSIAQIAKIASTNPSKGGGGGSGASAPSQPSAPSFNLVQGSASNQIAESLQTQQQPIKAIVVSSEMSNQQAVDRNIKATASI